MQKLLLALVALVFLVGVGATFLLWTGASSVEPANLEGPSPSAAPTGASPAAALTTPEAGSEPAARPSTAAAEARSPEEAPTTEGERTDAVAERVVRGFVKFPERTPMDEKATVRAVPSSDDPANVMFAFLSTARERETLATADVRPDGSFELALPEELDSEAWLILQGRYLISGGGIQVTDALEEPTFEPELGAWVTVRLTLPDDATEAELDLDDTSVTLRGDMFRAMAGFNALSGQAADVPQYRDRLDSDTRSIELTGVVPGEGYGLRIRPERLAASVTSDLEFAPGEHRILEVQLDRGGALAGMVVDENGDPVAEADLEVEKDPMFFGRGGYEIRDAESGADGRFALDALAPGKATLRVEADGFFDWSEEIEIESGRRVDGYRVQLDRGKEVAGRVEWPDGTPPPAGTEVELRFDVSQLGGMAAFNALKGADGEAKTDANGRFRITGLGNGPFTVRAEVEGGPDPDDEREWLARADGVQPNTTDLLLVLRPPVGVAGRVVDDAGEPVTKFKVLALQRAEGMMAQLGTENAEGSFEDEDGEFFLDGLREGEWHIRGAADGYGRAQEVAIQVPLPEGEELVLEIARASSARGIVTDAGGNPFAGANVSLQLSMADLGRVSGNREDRRPTTVSGPDGSFHLEGLTPGDVSLVAGGEGFAQSEPVPTILAPGEEKDGLVLRLRVGGRILGEVFDDEGSPAEGRTVLAQNPTNFTRQLWATSDGSGRFTMEHVEPGNWQVMTMPFGEDGPGDGVAEDDFASMFGEMKFSMAEVKDGEDTHVQLGSATAPVRVVGRVHAGDEPVAKKLVTFIADGGQGMSSMRFTNTDADGRFAVDLKDAGRYLVTVQQNDGTGMQQQSYSTLEEIPEDEVEYEVDIEVPLGGVRGRVLRPDGSPASNVRVTLSTEGPVRNGAIFGENYADVTTGKDGRFELVWLKPATYTVSVGGAIAGGLFGSGSNTPARQVRGGIEVREGQWVEGVDFRLTEPGELAGTVVDSSGNPVAKAAIFVYDENRRPLERFSLKETDGAGKFTYSGIAEGEYIVVARDASRVTTEDVKVRVRPGERASTRLVVDAGTVLIVSLTDREGLPVRCGLTVTDEAGRQVNGTMTLSEIMAAFSAGQFSSTEQRVGPIPPGTYTIEAVADDGKRAVKRLTLNGQPERKLKLRLRD